jgi:hypothetical protein
MFSRKINESHEETNFNFNFCDDHSFGMFTLILDHLWIERRPKFGVMVSHTLRGENHSYDYYSQTEKPCVSLQIPPIWRNDPSESFHPRRDAIWRKMKIL